MGVNQWSCSTYWFIFWFSNVLPVFTEVVVVITLVYT